MPLTLLKKASKCVNIGSRLHVYDVILGQGKLATCEEYSFHLVEPVVAPLLRKTRESCFEDRSTSAKLQEVISNVVVVWIAAAKGDVLAMTFNNAKKK